MFRDDLRTGASASVLEQHLDGLDDVGRLAAIRSLDAADQAKLYALAHGRPATLSADFVPADAAPLTEVIHEGKNSLLAFRLFQKRFSRPAADAATLVGYNEQGMGLFTGPGYFVAREARHESGIDTVVIDYTTLPTVRVPGWPPILPNTARLSRFIYNGTSDWMWRVSAHVTVGRARRASGWMDNWFVLCRRS